MKTGIWTQSTQWKAPRAFAKWLYEISQGDEELAAMLVHKHLGTCTADSFLWDLLEATGDKEYTAETIFKVARAVLAQGREEP